MESNCGKSVRLDRVHVGATETYTEALEEILGLLVDVQRAGLAVLGEVEGRDLGDVLILALTLLFLELEGDTTDGSSLNTLHPARR